MKMSGNNFTIRRLENSTLNFFLMKIHLDQHLGKLNSFIFMSFSTFIIPNAAPVGISFVSNKSDFAFPRALDIGTKIMLDYHFTFHGKYCERLLVFRLFFVSTLLETN